MIGETLLQSGAEGRVSPYIPFYFNGCQRSEVSLKFLFFVFLPDISYRMN